MARARHMAALSTPQDQRPEKSLPDIAVVEYAYHRLRSRLQDPSLAEALRTAALSGIDVKVMISARPSGNRLPDWAGNTYIEEIVAAGVRVFLYEKGYLHAKTISIDGAICSIGSANIDIRSFSINSSLTRFSTATVLHKSWKRSLRATSRTAVSLIRWPTETAGA